MALDQIALSPGGEGADVEAVVVVIGSLRQRGHKFHELTYELVVDGSLDVDALYRCARLSGVEQASPGNAGNGAVQIGVGQHDGRILATQFQAEGECPKSSFSHPGPSLVEADSASSRTGARYTDQADDQPANPTNLLSFTVDLTKCLSAQGRTFELGATGDFDLEAKACGGDRCIFPESPDSAGQSISFTRQ